MLLTPRVSAAWQYAPGELAPTASLALAGIAGANFTATGVPLARNAALVEAGADLRINRQAKIAILYSGQLASRVHDNAIKGNLLWSF
jgi:subtilase-type serine protease